MNNSEFNINNVTEIIKSDINKGFVNSYWLELYIKCENGETFNITCWAKEQDNLIIKHEQL